MQTETPSRTSASAMPRPMPLVPPVTSAVLFLSFILVWSAPAERSGDDALDYAGTAIQSGVALRLPPHSKSLQLLFQPFIHDLRIRFAFRGLHHLAHKETEQRIFA